MAGENETLKLSLGPPPQALHSMVPIVQVLSGSAAGLVHGVEGDVTMGRQADCDVVLDDEGVSRHHAKVSRNGSEVWLSDLHSTNGTHLRNSPIETALLSDGDIIMVGPVLLKFGYLSKAELELTKKMHEGANRDITSGTLNKVGFTERLTQEIAISTRQKGALSLVLCHIDNFQNVYDSGGLSTGHAVLAQFGQLLLSTCRLEDVIGRYDGENFGIILRSIELPNAASMSERLRKIVEKSTFPINDAIALQVTVSVGVVGWSAGETGEALIARAHEAMERAEKNRGNRVEIA